MLRATLPLDRWRRWRPFGIAKRTLALVGAVLLVSSLLALGPSADDDPPQDRTAAFESAAVTVAAAPAGTGPAIEVAPLPVLPPLGSDFVPTPAEDRETIAAVAQRERDRAAQQRAAEQRRELWSRLADCESGVRRGGDPVAGSARWDYGLAPGETAPFQGGLQFAPSTWDQFRDPGMPDHAGRATPEQQIVVAEQVLAAQGWRAWPVCSRMLGLRG